MIGSERTTRTVIKCPECETAFYSDQYGPENACDGCPCGNIDIGIIDSLEDSRYDFLVLTSYSKTPPEIYDEPLPPKEEDAEQPRQRIGFQSTSEEK